MNENKTSCAPADNQQTLWDRIDWTKAELAVRKLQARIVKAQKEGGEVHEGEGDGET